MSNLSFDIKTIFDINSEHEFNEKALKIFHWQAKNIPVYAEYISSLDIQSEMINRIEEIPFLPIQFFKSREVTEKGNVQETIFKSSGTTETGRSQHFVADLNLYQQSFTKGFELAYGKIYNTCVIALLPNYLEQGDSSLIYMIDSLIEQSDHSKSGFYLNEKNGLLDTLLELKKSNTKTILIGVTYALLDFIEKQKIDFSALIVMETGGMKGRRKEMVREELHDILCDGFGVSKIHSEYGMTELLSQAYSNGEGIFNTPSWMKILIREISDPLSLCKENKTGGVNVIDLANISSCCFISTQDLGRTLGNNQFEIIGRFDNSDARGCNLMIH
jgi:phenylacetate-coenzyme A ligase PaaK-like adenylate-forming protein